MNKISLEVEDNIIKATDEKTITHVTFANSLDASYAYKYLDANLRRTCRCPQVHQEDERWDKMKIDYLVATFVLLSACEQPTVIVEVR